MSSKILFALLLLGTAGAASAATFQPLSLNEDPLIWGVQANRLAESCDVSGSGLVSAFQSQASNLIANDRNGLTDIFVRAPAGLVRANRRGDGTESRAAASAVALSTTGRFVAFLSFDDLLNPGGPPLRGPFVQDLQLGTLSQPRDLAGGRITATAISLSGNGRYLFFVSADNDIVLADSNNASDVFRFDSLTNTTILVSVTATGVIGNAASSAPSSDDTGNLVAFASSASNFVAGDTAISDVFVKNVTTGAVVRASQTAAGVGGTGSSSDPSMAANGNFVVFDSNATNLDGVSPDINAVTDVYWYVLSSMAIERASFSAVSGPNANSASRDASVSANGRFVWFTSTATNLVAPAPSGKSQIFRRDMASNAVIMVSGGVEEAFSPQSSDDGQRACFQTIRALEAADTNRLVDIYLTDVVAGSGSRQSVADAPISSVFGTGNSSLLGVASNASRVLLHSDADDLDAASFGDAVSHAYGLVPTTQQISLLARDVVGAVPNSQIRDGSISADGNWATLDTFASNMGTIDSNNDMDTYRLHIPSGALNLVSVSTAGTPAGGLGFIDLPSRINDAGNRVAFVSFADNIVPGDTNLTSDLFLWDAAAPMRRLSVATGGLQSNNGTVALSMDALGERIAFASDADNLVAGDTNGRTDVFVHTVATGVTQRVSLDANGAQFLTDASSPAISSDGRLVTFLVAPPEILSNVAIEGIGVPPAGALWQYDNVPQRSALLTLPAGVAPASNSIQYQRNNPRFLSYIGLDGFDSVAYRYDRSAPPETRNRELVRTSLSIYGARHFIGGVRLASDTIAILDTNQPLSDADRNGSSDVLMVTLQPGFAAFNGTSLIVPESAGTIDIPVNRLLGVEGQVSVNGAFTPITAQAADFTVATGMVTWGDTLSGVQNLRLTIIDDAMREPNEALTVQLITPQGGIGLGMPNVLTITITDNDTPADLLFANGFE